jgi:hypothetical protein
MSVRGPLRCFCCGTVERTTGCVRGIICDCNRGVGWRDFGPKHCPVCKYCLNHCQCTKEMKDAALEAKIQYHKALARIADRNPDRINRRG